MSEEEDRIQVHCRIKPLATSDLPIQLQLDYGTHTVTAGPARCAFHRVFPPQSTQADVFEKTAVPLLESVCRGFNATLLAYGQTGSGKTHTICGELAGEQRGIIPRVAQYLLDKLDEENSPLNEVQFAVMEVYLDEIYDLSVKHQTKLEIKERADKTIFVKGLRFSPLTDYDDFVKRFKQASEMRKVAPTLQNDRSTRSHLVATFRVLGSVPQSRVPFDALFNLGDLSGSERVTKSGVEGKAFEQAVTINQDLSALRRVVLEIHNKGVPVFRETTLTRLLQPSIKGNCKTRFIFAVRVEPESVEDTIGTIRFAVDCSSLKNTVSISRVETIESLKIQLANAAEVIAGLKLENASLRMQLGKRPASVPEESPRVITRSTVEQWVQAATEAEPTPPPTEERKRPPPLSMAKTSALATVAERMRRSAQVSQTLPTNLTMYATVAETQTKLNMQVVVLESKLQRAREENERLLAKLNGKLQ